MNQPAMLMLAIHIVFGLVILCHFASLMVGFRMQMSGSGRESFELQNGYRVTANAIHFVNDFSVLTKPIKAMTSDEFSFESNYVQVSLYKNDLFLKSGRLSFLKPLVLDGIRFTLKNFLRPSVGKTDPESSTAGTILFISRNPAKNVVFTLFPPHDCRHRRLPDHDLKQPGYQPKTHQHHQEETRNETQGIVMWIFSGAIMLLGSNRSVPGDGNGLGFSRNV